MDAETDHATAERASTQAQIDIVNAALATGNAAGIAHALGVIARAKGMTEVAREAGVTREALYKSLSGEGDPRLTTLLGVTRALGMTLAAQVSVERKARPSAMDEDAADTSI